MKFQLWLLISSTSSIPCLRYALFHAPLSNLFAFLYFIIILLTTTRLTLLQDHQILVSRPPLPEGGPIQAVPVSAASEAPEAEDSQDGDEAEDSLEGTNSTTSPPPAHSEDLCLDKKRKHVEELLSSSTSASKAVIGEASAVEDEEELFDLLDS
jgi:hypothetical protein